jgi:hypothetical protein
MKKVISFSLWGDNPRYTEGALHNIKLAQEVYPSWICRFYLGTSTPVDIINKIKEEDNTEIVEMEEEGDWTGMFWRFYAASDPSVDVMISRDCDSRVWHREKTAVQEWLDGDKNFHIIRDHPYHGVKILGGMWGVKKPYLDKMKQLIDNYVKGNFWQVDQNFLGSVIYPRIRNSVHVHDEFFEKKPIPGLRDPKHFIGQAYAGNGKILDDDETFQQFIERYKNENSC